MSLRTALASLPDDRRTATAVREIVAYFDEHRSQPVDARRVERATGVSHELTRSVVSALVSNFVLDCDGDSTTDTCVFVPDTVLSLEVDRFLRSGTGSGGQLQRGVDRYRNRFGGGTRY